MSRIERAAVTVSTAKTNFTSDMPKPLNLVEKEENVAVTRIRLPIDQNNELTSFLGRSTRKS
jgi:hypothetical protein